MKADVAELLRILSRDPKASPEIFHSALEDAANIVARKIVEAL